MSELKEAVGAIIGLAGAGILFLVVESTLGTDSTQTLGFDWQLWGIVFVLFAILLAVILVVATIRHLNPVR